jgi:hypothetical protein
MDRRQLRRSRQRRQHLPPAISHKHRRLQKRPTEPQRRSTLRHQHLTHRAQAHQRPHYMEQQARHH